MKKNFKKKDELFQHKYLQNGTELYSVYNIEVNEDRIVF